jgi:FixJ family two-component response regulator
MRTPALSRVVHIVDDDPAIVRAIARLLRSHGYEAIAYASASEFLAAVLPPRVACLVLDLQMPDLDGLEMQQALAARKHTLPIVFISGHADIPASVQAMKAGAVDFLTKPFDDDLLIAAIELALSKSQAAMQGQEAANRDWRAFDQLSDRERQVCLYVSQGFLNKQIAWEFGTREQTVKVQRSSLMKKLGANSASDLVRLIERLRSSGYVMAPLATK